MARCVLWRSGRPACRVRSTPQCRHCSLSPCQRAGQLSIQPAGHPASRALLGACSRRVNTQLADVARTRVAGALPCQPTFVRHNYFQCPAPVPTVPRRALTPATRTAASSAWCVRTYVARRPIRVVMARKGRRDGRGAASSERRANGSRHQGPSHPGAALHESQARERPTSEKRCRVPAAPAGPSSRRRRRSRQIPGGVTARAAFSSCCTAAYAACQQRAADAGSAATARPSLFDLVDLGTSRRALSITAAISFRLGLPRVRPSRTGRAEQ